MPLPSVERQLQSLRLRRSVVDRLIYALEIYERITPIRVAAKKSCVA